MVLVVGTCIWILYGYFCLKITTLQEMSHHVALTRDKKDMHDFNVVTRKLILYRYEMTILINGTSFDKNIIIILI